MPHVHYCPECEINWECSNPDCEKYTAYLCLKCFEALVWPQCYKALNRDTGSAPSEEKTPK
jgi:hypothetical protein